eukprot:14612851-Alexandrium_andersonii.AAC.1
MLEARFAPESSKELRGALRSSAELWASPESSGLVHLLQLLGLKAGRCGRYASCQWLPRVARIYRRLKP